MKYYDEVENIFNRLVDEIKILLPDFGRILATDSKAIHSLARGPKRDKNVRLKNRTGGGTPMPTLAGKITKGVKKTAPCGKKWLRGLGTNFIP